MTDRIDIDARLTALRIVRECVLNKDDPARRVEAVLAEANQMQKKHGSTGSLGLTESLGCVAAIVTTALAEELLGHDPSSAEVLAELAELENQMLGPGSRYYSDDDAGGESSEPDLPF